MSDLLVNTNRGLFAEFVVARVLGDHDPVRDPWKAYDVLAFDVIKVEVRSAAYLQAWHQKRDSAIRFGIRPTTAWDPETGMWVGQRRRQAHVYVFALLAHKDKHTVDAADLTQWLFYAVSTRVLDRECGTANSVSLERLEKLGAAPVSLSELPHAVRAAASYRAVGVAMNPRIARVRVERPYVVRLSFTDGSEGSVDLGRWIEGSTGVFAALKEPGFFARVSVDPDAGTIVWPNGANLDPDVLYEAAHRAEVTPSDIEQG